MAEVETDVREIPLDENFEAAVKKLHTEGWGTVPGTKPYAVYHLCRVKQGAENVGGAMGVMRVDDSKVFIKRANGDIEYLK